MTSLFVVIHFVISTSQRKKHRNDEHFRKTKNRDVTDMESIGYSILLNKEKSYIPETQSEIQLHNLQTEKENSPETLQSENKTLEGIQLEPAQQRTPTLQNKLQMLRYIIIIAYVFEAR